MPPSVGARFGRYELLGRIGAGGMGEVFRARDHDLQRDVAIKFLPARFAADPVRLARFAQEARAASGLNHPNIVTIHETGQFDGLPYIVMELVSGETLRAMSSGGALPTKKALDLGAQLAEGLAKAHAAGIVHRDLKPENVMVTPDGFVKILDFGLAKLRENGERPVCGTDDDTTGGTTDDAGAVATGQGTVLGTVGYMSPEQARGQAADFRSDQFALGAILYELATGSRAFRRESAAQTLAAIIADEPRPLNELRPAFPAPARWVVERCLAKEPSERYASTLDIAHELHDIRAHLGDPSGSGSEAGPVAVPRRRFRAWHGVAASVALALGLVFTRPDAVLEWLRLLPLPAEKRLAVLPVQYSGTRSDDRDLCEGLHEYVIARLGELERFQRGFFVIPGPELHRAGVTVREQAARRLGVTLALGITVIRLDDRFVASVTLWDADRGRVLRSASRTAGTAEGLLDETVSAVVSLLDVAVDATGRAMLRAGSTSVAEASSLYAQALAHEPYEQARTALERYDLRESLERAVTLFNAALERDPRYALAHAGLGEAYVRLWQLARNPAFVDLAEQHCQRAIALDPLVPQVWLTLGILHGQTGKFEQALADFDRARARAPQSDDVARERAAVLTSMRRFEEAEQEYRAATALNPERWSAHSYLAAFLFRQGRLAEAETAWRQALSLAPENARLWSNLGAALYRQDRYAEADEAWRKSVAFHPTSAALANMATRRFFEGKFDEAVPLYERAANLAPRDYRVWRNYAAVLYWAPGGRARAADVYRTALDLAEQNRTLDPANAVILVELADCLAHTGAGDRARTTLAEALRLSPRDAYVTSNAAGVFEHLGDRDLALRWLAVALEEGYSRTEVEHDPNFTKLRADPRYAALGSGGTG